MRRSYVAERLSRLVQSAVIPVCITLTLELVLQWAAAGRPPGSPGGAVFLALPMIAAAWVGCRCGIAYMVLQFAPIYPRVSYYGNADIAPEEPWRHRVEQALLPGGALLAVIPAGIATALLGDWPAWAPWLGLSLGVGLQAWRCRVLYHPAQVQALEQRLRGNCVLYLRSFGRSGLGSALATLQAAAPQRMLMVVSPGRIESRTWGWYGVSVLMPRSFDRLALWSTVDEEWDRVVASCMDRASAIVVDCAGLGDQPLDKQGIGLELGISLGFAKDRRTAYLLRQGQRLPPAFPEPAALWLSAGRWARLRQFRPAVSRLRAVLRRELPAEQEAWIEAHFAKLAQDYEDALIGDELLARREGREDPQRLLLRRRSQRTPSSGDGGAPGRG